MNLDPGKLRHRVELQRFVLSTDTVGNQLSTWETAEVVWAAVNSLYGQEYWAAAAQGQQNTLVFVLRWSPMLGDVIADCDFSRWRLSWEGRLYTIQSAEDVQFAHNVVRIRAVKKP